MPAPSKSKVKLMTSELIELLEEIRRDYGAAHDMAHEPARRQSDRISGGAVGDPTGEMAVSREALKSHLRHVGHRLQSLMTQTLEVRNNLQHTLHGADEPKPPPEEDDSFPRVITKEERRAIHEGRERKLRFEASA